MPRRYKTRRKYNSSKDVPTELVKHPKLKARILKLSESANGLGSRTRNFLDSILDWVEKHDGLTAKQYEWFEKIESEHNSPDARKSRAIWEERWQKENLKEKVDVVIAYYNYYNQLTHRNIFKDWIDDYESNPDSILPEKAYNRMIKVNSYAQKILEAHFDPPKYPTGSLVKFRKSPKVPERLRQKLGIVVVVNAAPVINAARGTKQYRVLPFGESSPVLIEERYLCKGKKK